MTRDNVSTITGQMTVTTDKLLEVRETTGIRGHSICETSHNTSNYHQKTKMAEQTQTTNEANAINQDMPKKETMQHLQNLWDYHQKSARSITTVGSIPSCKP